MCVAAERPGRGNITAASEEQRDDRHRFTVQKIGNPFYRLQRYRHACQARPQKVSHQTYEVDLYVIECHCRRGTDDRVIRDGPCPVADVQIPAIGREGRACRKISLDHEVQRIDGERTSDIRSQLQQFRDGCSRQETALQCRIAFQFDGRETVIVVPGGISQVDEECPSELRCGRLIPVQCDGQQIAERAFQFVDGHKNRQAVHRALCFNHGVEGQHAARRIDIRNFPTGVVGGDCRARDGDLLALDKAVQQPTATRPPNLSHASGIRKRQLRIPGHGSQSAGQSQFEIYCNVILGGNAQIRAIGATQADQQRHPEPDTDVRQGRGLQTQTGEQ